jgi:histidinol dehydrogenase
MNVFKQPSSNTWKELVQRPQLELGFLDSAVRNILNRVRKSGDTAIRELTLQYDKTALTDILVPEKEIQSAIQSLSEELTSAIKTAASNIEKFHNAQKREPVEIETTEGVVCWRKAVAIQRVGIYIPGGTAPLFSTVLMLGIPAKLAGCTEIILCTPPDKSGKINPAILFAATLVGVTKICKAGGAQAIAALAYGTESIPAVSKIFGPGNQYVTKAKQLVTEDGLAIDMPAGPSEVLIYADDSADTTFVAADLLSQAEHGEDSQVMLVLTNENLVGKIQEEIALQLERLPRKEIARRSLNNSRVLVLKDPKDAIAFINEYAPEHLILNIRNADSVVDEIKNAGSVFLGNYSPEAIGDYASGTNHTLPTNGFAKAYAGVSLESYMKYITYQRVSEKGIRNLGPVVEIMAEAEELVGHKMAIRVRLEKLKA